MARAIPFPDMAEHAFASTLSKDPDAARAERQTTASLLEALGRSPDLLLAFATHHYAGALEGLGERLQRATGARHMAGCTGLCVVAGATEVEQEPGLALFGALLGDTEVRLNRVVAGTDGAGELSFGGGPELEASSEAGMVLLADPFSFPAHLYLPRLAEEFPGVSVVGGLAAGGQGPGQNYLWRDGKSLDGGALAITLEGEVVLETAVSQGCRPVGEPLVITSCEGHLIHRLRGKPAPKVLFDLIGSLPEEDRDLFKRGAHIGLAIDATRSHFEAEDLLVRNLLGIHPQENAIAVGDDSLRNGMTVQIMVRDGASASEELRRILSSRAEGWRPDAPREAGALLFTCSGRGRGMFGEEHHDARSIQEHLGPDLPLTGFFANGEIGPVAGRPFVHGFTASVGLLRAKEATV